MKKKEGEGGWGDALSLTAAMLQIMDEKGGEWMLCHAWMLCFMK
jgi:hypothetical protein